MDNKDSNLNNSNNNTTNNYYIDNNIQNEYLLTESINEYDIIIYNYDENNNIILIEYHL